MKKKTLLKEIKKLKYFKIKESEIKKNFEYYMNNFDEIKKVNCIIQNAKQLKIYNQSPADFVKEERGIYSSFPSKWEDLFNLKISKSNIDLFYYLLSTSVKKLSVKKETTINELKKLKKFCTTDVADVSEIANYEKKVPLEWISSSGNYVTDDFINYVRPLIQGELSPTMVKGLPAHIQLLAD